MKSLKSIIIALVVLLNSGMVIHAQEKIPAVTGNNKFAFKLYEEINDEEENVFFSPYSISSALAMTYNGAKGTTGDEMAEVLNFTKDKEALSADFKQLNEDFRNFNQEDLKLHIANSLWCQQDLDFKQSFLDMNAKYYDAGIQKVNFAENYKEIRKEINQWVEKKTQNKIQDLIQKGMLDKLTRLVLVNAIYFKGMWEFPFDEKKTKEDTFYVYSECMTKADFMHRDITAKYYKDDLAKVIEIPYSGKQLSMMIIMPLEKYGMRKLENKLDNKLYESYNKSLYSTKVKLSLPKFKINAGYELNKPLSELGMKSAFGKNADFSGITDVEELYISNVIHKSFVEVNEEGTEAAAATGVVMRKTTAIMKKEVFEADHPFIFFIKDNKTGSILFMGRVMNPKKD
jgi:serpin B